MPERSTWPDLGGLVKAAAVVGEVASMIPGPVGAAAAGISTAPTPPSAGSHRSRD